MKLAVVLLFSATLASTVSACVPISRLPHIVVVNDDSFLQIHDLPDRLHDPGRYLIRM